MLVGLLDLDRTGFPNVALMKLSAWHKAQGDTTVLTLPLSFNWNGLAGAARTALGYGELPYTMKGQLSVATPIGERTVAFTRQGRAPLSRVGTLLQTGH